MPKSYIIEKGEWVDVNVVSDMEIDGSGGSKDEGGPWFLKD